MMHRRTLAALLAAILGTSVNVANADDVCSAAERQAANAQLARAKAAESAGNLTEALKLAKGADFCVDDVAGLRNLVIRASHQLGKAAEAAGNLEQAFAYYKDGMAAEQYVDPKPVNLLENAKRVGLAMVEAQPADRKVARQVLEFMNRENQSDGVARMQKHIHAQAERLLAEEAKAFSVKTPHTELLEEAEAWLQEEVLTGVPVSSEPTAAELKSRRVTRGDTFAALDYHTALAQAMGYYDDAERADKQDAVKAKARKLADGLADGNQWAEAVRLYELAGDQGKAEALTERREASAAEVEAERKATFQQEQDDLEDELGF